MIALVAALLSALAVAIAWRAQLAALALLGSLVLAGAASAGSISFDRNTANEIRHDFLPANAGWIDQTGLRHILLMHTPATLHARSLEQLFWNRSVDDVLYYGQASQIDAFGNRRVNAARDGRFVTGGKTVRAPLLISNYAVRMRLRGAKLVARERGYDLWRPVGTPRLALFVGGLYHDRWLAQAGTVELWPPHASHMNGTLRWRLGLPSGTLRTVLELRAPGIHRRVVVLPRHATTLTVPVNGRGPWTLHYQTKRPGYLNDGRTISVKAETPVFTPQP